MQPEVINDRRALITMLQLIAKSNPKGLDATMRIRRCHPACGDFEPKVTLEGGCDSVYMSLEYEAAQREPPLIRC